MPHNEPGSQLPETFGIGQEEYFQIAAKVLEVAAEAVMVTDQSGNIVVVNDAFEEITGYSKTEILGQNPSMLSTSDFAPEFYATMWRDILEKGRWQGETYSRRKNGQVYPQWLTITVIRDQDGEVVYYIRVFTDITERREREQKIEFLAHHDHLTGLLNRVLFADRVEHAIAHAHRGGRKFAIVFIDMDRFKHINDTLGHAVGDQLLVHVASRIKAMIREDDTACRYGGDEFVVLLEEINHREDIASIAERILQAASTPIEVEENRVSATLSIGIAVYPDDGEAVELLLQNADVAMYQAKQSGRAACKFFSPEMLLTMEETHA